MATLLVLQAARAALSDAQKAGLRLVGRRVMLGEPAFCADPEGRTWACYDDGRFTPRDAALAGCILAHLAEFPDFDPEQVEDVRAECVRFCEAHGLVWPIDGLEDTENPYQTAYDAQGGPPVMRVEFGPRWPAVAWPAVAWPAVAWPAVEGGA